MKIQKPKIEIAIIETRIGYQNNDLGQKIGAWYVLPYQQSALARDLQESNLRGGW
jgi:hypothetical protein